MGNFTIFYNKRSENSRSQIVFRTDIFRKLTLGAPVWSREQRKKGLAMTKIRLRVKPKGVRLQLHDSVALLLSVLLTNVFHAEKDYERKLGNLRQC